MPASAPIRITAHVCPVCRDAQCSSWTRAGLLQCATCGVIFDPALWHGAAYAEHLTNEFFGRDFVERADRWQRWFEAAVTRRTWRRLVRHMTPPASLLEVGVGSGSLLAFAAKRGMPVAGCDLSQAVCHHVRRRRGIAVRHGRVADLPACDRFDVIVMNHVLEHVPDPVGSLEQIRARLMPHGVLHVAVPNVASWNARFSGWTSYVRYHLVYFTPESLRYALARAGFDVVACETFEPFSGWLLTLARTFIRRFVGAGTSEETPSIGRGRLRHAYRIVMVAFGLLTAPFRWIQSRLGFGEELIVVARVSR